MLMTQLTLTSGNKQLTTWVDHRPGLKPGVLVSLKKRDERWRIERVFSTQDDKSINKQEWNNNI